MEIPINPQNQSRWDLIMSAPPQIEGDSFPSRLADACAYLWQDHGVREAFGRRNELQLNDSAP